MVYKTSVKCKCFVSRSESYKNNISFLKRFVSIVVHEIFWKARAYKFKNGFGLALFRGVIQKYSHIVYIFFNVK